MRAKYKDIPVLRQKFQEQQNNLCGLCEELITEQRPAVLDHDHKTGLIRGVLHRGCNSLLGKIENNQLRSQLTDTALERLLQNYSKYTSTEHTDILHPTYKTKEQRKDEQKRRRRQNAARSRQNGTKV